MSYRHRVSDRFEEDLPDVWKKRTYIETAKYVIYLDGEDFIGFNDAEAALDFLIWFTHCWPVCNWSLEKKENTHVG